MHFIRRYAPALGTAQDPERSQGNAPGDGQEPVAPHQNSSEQHRRRSSSVVGDQYTPESRQEAASVNPGSRTASNLTTELSSETNGPNNSTNTSVPPMSEAQQHSFELLGTGNSSPVFAVPSTGQFSSAERLGKDSDSLRRIQDSVRRNIGETPSLPQQSDFPQSLTLSIIPTTSKEQIKNMVILLHPRGGTEESLEELAKKLHEREPETAFILLRGPVSATSKNNGFDWADTHSDSAEEFLGSRQTLLEDIINTVLISKCRFEPRKIILLGYGQGGVAALATTTYWNRIEFGGVVSLGGTLPDYAQHAPTFIAKTPALILRNTLQDIDARAIQHLRDHLIHVDVATGADICDTLSKGSGKAMPVLEPILEFFAHRFRREEWIKQTILSFDGGGIRGYGSLLILRELMNKVGDEEKRRDREDGAAESSFAPCIFKPTKSQHVNEGGGHVHPESPMSSKPSKADGVATPVDGLLNSSLFLPCHYFTYAAGTSTGGLISIMLSRFRMTVEDCITVYKRLGDQIFGHPRPLAKGAILWHKFDSKVLEEVIKDVTLCHSPNSEHGTKYPSPEDLCRTIVLAQGGKDNSESPYLFRTYFASPRAPSSRLRAIRNPGEAPQIPLWQVARATSAAPGYFAPQKIPNGEKEIVKFKDGGFGSNNPSDEAYYDVVHKHGGIEKNIGLFISIGTGTPPYEIIAKNGGNLNNAIANIRAAMKHPSRTLKVDELMGMFSERDGKEVFPYYRFDGGERLGEIALDEWESHKYTRLTGKSREPGEKTVEKLYEATAVYLRQPSVQTQLKECAKLLVKRRRLRTRDKSAWDRYASASSYVCSQTGCQQKRIDTSEQYMEHLRQIHYVQVPDEFIEKTMLDSRDCWLYK